MLYPLSYERTAYEYTAASGLPVRVDVYAHRGWLDLDLRLFRLDPADQVIPADRFQQGWMVGGHVPADHPDHLVIVIAAGHVPALASDQLHHRLLAMAVCPA